MKRSYWLSSSFFLFLRDWRVTLIHRYSGFIDRSFLCDVHSRFLHQCADHAGGGIVCRFGSDDAIVMTENIYIRIERGMRPFEAGIEGAKEIFFAVYLQITLVAVFLPIVFMWTFIVHGCHHSSFARINVHPYAGNQVID